MESQEKMGMRNGDQLNYPKRVRLCSKIDIDRIFQHGRYRKLGALHSKFVKNDTAESRFLISVKKKIGRAHQRIRIKRVVREAIRLNRHQLHHSFDFCLFLTHTPSKPADLAMMESEIQQLFRYINRKFQTGGRNS